MLACRDLSQSNVSIPSSCLNLQKVKLLVPQRILQTPNLLRRTFHSLSPGFQIAVPSRELAKIMSLF